MSLWVYRGEGNAHIVVSHKQKHIVYRMFKKKKNGILTRKKFKSDYQHLREKVLKYLAFTTNVMLPRIDRKYLHCGSLVEISQSLAQNIKASLENRPEYRQDKELDENCPYVLEMPDYCHVNQNSHSNCCNGGHTNNHTHNKYTQPVYTIEIKPKWGFLPTTDCISPSNKIKHTVCRYCMHQYLKVSTGKWKHHSYYCPIDLFSGDKDRMKHSLKMLFASPQNNFRIFKDGKALWNDQIHELTNSEERFLREFCQRNDGDITQDLKTLRHQFDCFLELLVQCLLHDHSTKCDPPRPPATHNHLHQSSTAHQNDCSTSQPVIAAQGRDHLGSHATGGRDHLITQGCAASTYTDRNGHQGTRGTVSPLPRGCVLYQILRTQQMDDIDIEGIEPLYRHVKEAMATNQGPRTMFDFNGPYEASWCPDNMNMSFPPNTTSYAVRKIKEFLVSRSAKDCSIMISLKQYPDHHPWCRRQSIDQNTSCRSVLSESSTQEPTCHHSNSLHGNIERPYSDHCSVGTTGHHGDHFCGDPGAPQSLNPELPSSESPTDSIQRSNHTNFLATDRDGSRHLVNIAIIDLDPKPFDRIESYIREDREVVQNYTDYLSQRK